MREIDFSNTYFSYNNIIPESGDDMTVLWFRKIMENLANAYGIIGSVTINTSAPSYISYLFNRRYRFPPYVQVLWKLSSETQYKTVADGDAVEKAVTYAISSDGVAFVTGPKYRTKTIDVVFKIHGV